MPSPLESQAILRRLTFEADQKTRALLAGLTGTPEQILAQLLEAMPQLIGYYTDGSAALAADLFDDLRDGLTLRRRFRADPVVIDRTEKIRNAIAWAADPEQARRDRLAELQRKVADDREERSRPGSRARLLSLQEKVAADRKARIATPEQRLAEVVQREVARPYRDTITVNSQRDPDSVGWTRVSGDSCGFCRMLASRGAVYMRETARFAAHGHCDCTAAPVFNDGRVGPEADAFQYLASKRTTSARDKARLRSYLAANFPD